MIRLHVALSLAVLMLSGSPATAAAGQTAVPDNIAAAVASPLRAAAHVARDASQKPAEVLRFAGVKPGDRVADFWPTPPYSTALLSGAVGAGGHVYAIIPAKLFHDIPQAEPKVLDALKPYRNVTPLVEAFDQFSTPEALDMVWLGKIYHDFPNAAEMGPLDIAAVDRAIYRSLKPGGVLIVIDHAAAPGSGFRDTDPDDARRLHRIDPETVKAELRAAGFELVAESPLLANPGDDHKLSAFDPAIRNRTDRFILKLRKPMPPAR